jgi:hypothetical protein
MGGAGSAGEGRTFGFGTKKAARPIGRAALCSFDLGKKGRK